MAVLTDDDPSRASRRIPTAGPRCARVPLDLAVAVESAVWFAGASVVALAEPATVVELAESAAIAELADTPEAILAFRVTTNSVVSERLFV